MMGRGASPDGDRATRPADQAPAGLHPLGFDPSRWHGQQYSPNLGRWLAKQARRRGGLWGPPSVYRDEKGQRWIGIHDNDQWFYGTRLPRCLTVGARAEVYAHPPRSLDLTEEPDFWRHYDRIGRCHIDPQHNGWWATESERWRTEGDERSCLWCGEHTQRLRRWTETVERERWEPAIAMEARQGRNREDGSDPKDDSAGPQDIAHIPQQSSSKEAAAAKNCGGAK